MKTILNLSIFAAAFVAIAGSLCAETYSVDLNRFSRLTLDTGAGKVTIVEGSKMEDDKVRFEGKVTAGDNNTYTTDGGVKFAVDELAEAYIQDANRGINSGKWSIRVSGEGDEHAKVLGIIKELTGSDEDVVYGDKQE